MATAANPYAGFLGDKEPYFILRSTVDRIRELTAGLTPEQIFAETLGTLFNASLQRLIRAMQILAVPVATVSTSAGPTLKTGASAITRI